MAKEDDFLRTELVCWNHGNVTNKSKLRLTNSFCYFNTKYNTLWLQSGDQKIKKLMR